MNKGFESAQPRQEMCAPLYICTSASVLGYSLRTEVVYLILNVFVALKTGASCANYPSAWCLEDFLDHVLFFSCLLSVWPLM